MAITNEDKDAPNVHYIYICTKVDLNYYDFRDNKKELSNELNLNYI